MCKGKADPLQAKSGPEGSRKLLFPDFMTMAQDNGKIVSLTHRPPLPPGNAPGTHFCYRMGRPQDNSAIGRILCQWEIPMTPAGIEPATFRFVAQHLNHCATAVPSNDVYLQYINLQLLWEAQNKGRIPKTWSCTRTCLSTLVQIRFAPPYHKHSLSFDLHVNCVTLIHGINLIMWLQ